MANEELEKFARIARERARTLGHWLRALGRNLYFWGGFGALLLLAGSALAVFDTMVMPSYTRHSVSIQVPDVQNRPFDDARDSLRSLDLQVERQEGRYNPNVDRGVVVDQNPPPSSPVKPGRRVYLTVNTGEVPSVKLPDLAGTSIREAKNQLSALGLSVGAVRPDPIPSPYPNTITRQRPASGDSLKQGSAVDLWYSQGLGSDSVRVPDVRALTVKQAEQALLDRRLRSVIIGPDTTEDLSGLWVREQGRSPGSSAIAGTEVRLFATPDSSAVDTTTVPADSVGGRPDSVRAQPNGADGELSSRSGSSF
jgi:beta-lactam-binding protein with PASTA domain